jgi:hypothetical protein
LGNGVSIVTRERRTMKIAPSPKVVAKVLDAVAAAKTAAPAETPPGSFTLYGLTPLASAAALRGGAIRTPWLLNALGASAPAGVASMPVPPGTGMSPARTKTVGLANLLDPTLFDGAWLAAQGGHFAADVPPLAPLAPKPDLAVFVGDLKGAKAGAPRFNALVIPGAPAAGKPLIGGVRLDVEQVSKWVDFASGGVDGLQKLAPGLSSYLGPVGVGFEGVAIIVSGMGFYDAAVKGDRNSMTKYAIVIGGSACGVVGDLTGVPTLSWIGFGLKSAKSFWWDTLPSKSTG